MKLKEVARLVNGRIQGKGDPEITSVAQLDEAKKGQITFIANLKYASLLPGTKASAVIVQEGKSFPGVTVPLLFVKNVYMALAVILKKLVPPVREKIKGISKVSLIGKRVRLGKNAAVGAYAVIGEGVSIGEDTQVHPNVYIGPGTEIGSNVLIYPNVTIMHGVKIGNNVIVQSGTVIGSDGYGYATVDGRHFKVPQVGTGVIEDDVEIGSNVTIDRAAIGKTVIGAGTKIDNLVMIAHSVKIGKNCLIIAQVGISGSTVVGNNVILAGQAGLVGHIEIGDNAIVGAKAGVSKNVPANQIVSGYHAREHKLTKRIIVQQERLTQLFKDVKELKDKNRKEAHGKTKDD